MGKWLGLDSRERFQASKTTAGMTFTIMPHLVEICAMVGECMKIE
jgi:hypothetical protein